jgi:hypothetical protein
MNRSRKVAAPSANVWRRDEKMEEEAAVRSARAGSWHPFCCCCCRVPKPARSTSALGSSHTSVDNRRVFDSMALLSFDGLESQDSTFCKCSGDSEREEAAEKSSRPTAARAEESEAASCWVVKRETACERYSYRLRLFC